MTRYHEKYAWKSFFPRARPGLSLKLADPTNAVADLCLERAHTGSSVAAGIMGVKISAKPDLDGDTG